ncbi:gas vesicle protein GvpJ [Haloferacaceae archaeon DSL9]
MSSGGAVRRSDSLADVVEMLLDKGIVINADIVVTIGDTQLLGIHLRAAIASFETAAAYGLAFPEGTDMERVNAVAKSRPRLEPLDERDDPGDRELHGLTPMIKERDAGAAEEEAGDSDDEGGSDDEGDSTEASDEES